MTLNRHSSKSKTISSNFFMRNATYMKNATSQLCFHVEFLVVKINV